VLTRQTRPESNPRAERKGTSGLSSGGSEGADDGPSRLQSAEQPGKDVSAGSVLGPKCVCVWGGRDYDLRGHRSGSTAQGQTDISKQQF